jgi:ABC-type phosphate transport system ATPase subunit
VQELIQELKSRLTIVIAAHNMQAGRTEHFVGGALG